MDHDDRQAISGLFDRLAQVAQQGDARDPEAERYITDLAARQPGAAYYLSQTVLVQEQALNGAQARIEQLQAELAQAQTPGGFLSRLFGGSGAQPASRMQAVQQPAQGGFMAGAAQTAMGVAGGVLLGNAIAGMLARPAEAAEEPREDSPMSHFGDDGGGGGE